ncbi:M13 family metallopeptidase [Providencia stuartii]|uniref:Endothelin-converting protein 1 n=1 Tax=Providencia stuartii (strain MRSN 2154) TaxID=1157951 RepID=A0A140NFW1_PROSM|nr:MULTISPECIES: M13 family metallopeptidase [Providencia]AFH91995.1 endothelin-converting protein 1 [Providencia stuartii MRSN 2154]MDE8747318.1 M13 family metallopeptidase [Providencia thailandensis]MDE8766324.1 M13 family metallopeptidase [Providencia thailandensis]MDE8778561.1 M13 family metallopeptidase [Providencia thailandensis]MDE8782681.1 M13 family metallopeptidase [Providencia thailandensis]
MQKKILALLISMSTIAIAPSLYAKEVSYGDQKIVLSDNIASGDDFYRYVNQDWISKAKIPTGMPRINSFVELYLTTEKQLQSIIDQLQSSPEKELNHNQRNIRNLYVSYLNEDAIEKIGISPLKDDLDAITNAKNHNDISKLMALPAYTPFISYWVDLDAKQPDTYVLYLGQGGLGLPNRNYYLDDTPQMEEIRKNYIAYIATILKLAGENDVEKKAQQIFALEKSMAQAHWSPEARRDTIKNYHPMTLNDMKKFTQGFAWDNFIQQWQLSDKQLNKVIVETDTAVEQLAKIYANTPVSTLQEYLRFHYLSDQAPYLNRDFSDARFDFYSRKLNGVEKQRTRKERALETVNRLQGEPMGQIYVEKYFNPESKAKITDLVSYVRGTFNSRLKDNDWMDDATRQEALKKLEQFTVKVGYPDKWNDFSSINLKPDTLLDNYKQVLNWVYNDNMSKIGQPVRKWEWGMTPQTINAYFNPVQNEIVFPAAILQAPFFDPNVDPAYNYGAIGAVIGHEMGHGFDDQGSLYDGTGQLRNWWSDDSKQHFKQKTDKLVEQYNSFSVDGQKVNGQLTLGENIGDLGGLNIALSAYKQFVKENYPNGEAPIIDGTTGLQRFFISWARTWQELSNKESERNKILTDPHSPNQFRANGVVRNMDEWYQTFGVDKDSKLYLEPEQRIRIW